MPIALPALAELAERAVPSTSSSKADPGSNGKASDLQALCHAVEDVWSSPGFLAAGFALPSREEESRPAVEDKESALVSLGIQWHHLDINAIKDLYQVQPILTIIEWP